jgi:hypothetical protein
MGRQKRIEGGVERGAERIANDLKDVTMVSLDRRAQDGVVLRVCGRHRLRRFLPQARAACDIGK